MEKVIQFAKGHVPFKHFMNLMVDERRGDYLSGGTVKGDINA